MIERAEAGSVTEPDGGKTSAFFLGALAVRSGN
jgi:hypothetical protein